MKTKSFHFQKGQLYESVLIEKLTVAQLVQAFYRTRKCIYLPTRVLQENSTL
jgi:predicted transposase YdaD